jgi:hypothetical protein
MELGGYIWESNRNLEGGEKQMLFLCGETFLFIGHQSLVFSYMTTLVQLMMSLDTNNNEICFCRVF